jgi:hypothetical protein
MPTVPPAPPLFSTTMGWPRAWAIWSISRRPTLSVMPPAA